MYSGSKLRWRLRPVRRALHGPVSWYRHQSVRPTDVIIASYPRSGSTWTTMMLAELLAGRTLDFESLDRVVPTVGHLRHASPLVIDGGRLLRTHEPYRRDYGRAIYVIRDPRDVALSYYHYRQWTREYHAGRRDFVNMFLDGRVDTYGLWSEHVRSWLDAPTYTRLVVRFESLRADAGAELRRIAAFLRVGFHGDAVEEVVRRNSVAGMQEKERGSFGEMTAAGHRFVRAGRVGGWQEEFTPAEVQSIVSRFGATMTLAGYDAGLTPSAV